MINSPTAAQPKMIGRPGRTDRHNRLPLPKAVSRKRMEFQSISANNEIRMTNDESMIEFPNVQIVWVIGAFGDSFVIRHSNSIVSLMGQSTRF
jgi:hypothetical protein